MGYKEKVKKYKLMLISLQRGVQWEERGSTDGTICAHCPAEESSLHVLPKKLGEADISLRLLSNILGGELSVFCKLTSLRKGSFTAFRRVLLQLPFSLVTAGLLLSLRHRSCPTDCCSPQLSQGNVAAAPCSPGPPRTREQLPRFGFVCLF